VWKEWNMIILIKGMERPKSCVGCEWRDAEAGGDCELMIRNPFESYEEQYKHCPFQEISKRYSLVPVPPHGRLIDADALEKVMSEGIAPSVKDGGFKHPFDIIRAVANAPTIIPAEEGE
jgi:hypothetical protein